jgi:beta-galactosidase
MKRISTVIVSLFLITQSYAVKKYELFPKEQLITTGVYYYPEHWPENQWERDIKKISEMGFEFTHFAEFAWAQLEPEQGKYDFSWLDKAVSLAEKYNIKVIMCTSTATPPVWLVRQHPDILLKDEYGYNTDHGSRQHASFSNNFYREYSMKMIEELAKHYAKNKNIIGWQLDNEPKVYYDFGNDAQQRFRNWLKNKYITIEALNNTWGTAFWSQQYTSFDQINIPRHNQWGMNLNQRLDHTRFVAHETNTFLNEQAKTIRAIVPPNQWITTNYAPGYKDGIIGESKELDFITYTRYMVHGDHDGIGEKGYRLGDFTTLALANDFIRPLSQAYGVMELQPGQVNWGDYNPQPAPGAVKMWLWHQFAGGSQLVCTYRYRAPLYGYEQYHYGIVSYDGITPTSGGLDFEQFIKDIKVLRENTDAKKIIPSEYLSRKTAILFNNNNIWGLEQNKQTKQWNSMEHILKYYRPLKQFGAPVDFIRDDFNFNNYPVIVAPSYQLIDKALIKKLTEYVINGGNLVMSCRTGHKNREGHLWESSFGEPIYDLIGAEIEFYDMLLPENYNHVMMGAKSFEWTTWAEILNPKSETEIWSIYKDDFYENKPAVIHRRLGKGSVTYIGVDSRSGELEAAVLKKVFNTNSIPIAEYPKGVIIEYRDGFGIAVNYSENNYELPLSWQTKYFVGNKKLETGGVSVWKVDSINNR